MLKRPLIGVAVIICKDNKVLLGERKNAHGDGTWAFPGGHLEFNESIEDCARREVLEETDLHIENIRHCAFTNDLFQQEQKHYVTLFVMADHSHGQLALMEPDKCEQWDWFDWDDLPKPKFLPLVNLLKQGFKLTEFSRRSLHAND